MDVNPSMVVSHSAASCVTAVTAVSSTAAGPKPVGRRSCCAIRPSAWMATASVLVPPMSIPTRSGANPVIPSPPRRRDPR